MDLELEIFEHDQNVLSGEVRLEGTIIRFMSDYVITGGTLHLERLHLDGPGKNKLLKSMYLRAAVLQLGIEFGVSMVEIQGGQRVTGAATGPAGAGPREPKRLIFPVRKP